MIQLALAAVAFVRFGRWDSVHVQEYLFDDIRAHRAVDIYMMCLCMWTYLCFPVFVHVSMPHNLYSFYQSLQTVNILTGFWNPLIMRPSAYKSYFPYMAPTHATDKSDVVVK